MKSLKLLFPTLIINLLFTLCFCSFSRDSSKYKPLAIPGTIKISDTFSVGATEISVYEYCSFIVANGFDSTLFPSANFIDKAPYKELFTDLYNKTYNRFLKSKGRGTYTFYFKHPTGNKLKKRLLKNWLDMPIGGISQVQAIRYCTWLENYYNQFLKRLNSIYFYEIRLATETELNLALHAKRVRITPGFNDQTSFRFVAIIHKR